MKRQLVPVLLLFLLGCKDKYESLVQSTDNPMLVVEGILNVGGPTTVKLSKTFRLGDKGQMKPELRAVVAVEGKDNSKVALSDAGNGTYFTSLLNVQLGKDYRLTIRTANGRLYASDYVTAKKTPAIDSVSWKSGAAVTFYVSTHDATNRSRYYKWDYEETWEIQSVYDPAFKWTGGSTIVSTARNQVFTCWRYASATKILLGSSVQLSSDVIDEAPVAQIDIGSEKAGVRYSVLVKQNAISKGAYDFFQVMKKNTELQGGIFDPQPSEMKGNVHNLQDPNEMVIGFVDASSVEEKRIFVTSQQIGRRYVMDCPNIQVVNTPAEIEKWVPSFLPYDVGPGPAGTSYLFAAAECVDCTKRGGSTTKPAYW